MSAAVGYISILQVNGVDLPVSSDITDQDWRRRSRRSAEEHNHGEETHHNEKSMRAAEGGSVPVFRRSPCPSVGQGQPEETQGQLGWGWGDKGMARKGKERRRGVKEERERRQT